MVEYTLNDRKRDRAFADFDVRTLRGVEIGPLDRPLIKRSDSDIYYVDHASNDDLNEKYTSDPFVDTANIPTIDFVWKDKSLVEMIGDKGPLDYIIASHVIEHVPDLIGWLKEMHAALRVGGTLILVVPDKRFTFDFFRRTSAYEEVFQAHYELRRRPGLRCIMDHFANVVTADTSALWNDYSASQRFKFCHGPEYLELAQRRFNEGLYIDVHCWVFTPWSFFSLLGRIIATNGLGFDLKYFLTTQTHDLEFYVQLERVEKPATDWIAAAIDAYENALQPQTGRQSVPAHSLSECAPIDDPPVISENPANAEGSLASS